MPRGLLSAGLFDKKYTNCSIEMEAFSLTRRYVCLRMATTNGVIPIKDTKPTVANMVGSSAVLIVAGRTTIHYAERVWE